MMMFSRLANPARFDRLAKACLPWTLLIALYLLAIGFYGALFASPPDYQQKEAVRIMYVHVPAAWLGLMIYTFMAAASAVALIWKHPLAEIATREAAPIGLVFTGLCLVTGSLWGKPMWGAWWVWDARLTSVLILFFFYAGYLALADAFEDPERGLRVGSILALIGFVNVPIVKFSVEWWNTLHQPASLLRMSGPAIDPSMLWPLWAMILGYTLFFVSVWLLRMRRAILERKLTQARVARLTEAMA